MKLLSILLFVLLLTACSEKNIEEYVFRNTLEKDLVGLCGEDDKACIKAVKAQTKGCMEKCDWRRYLENDEDEEELKRFTTEFYACIVDEDGNPYFEPNFE